MTRASRSKKKLYMEVTPDKYELPVRVADSVGELAEMCGCGKRTIQSAITHYNAGYCNSKYRRVVIDDD